MACSKPAKKILAKSEAKLLGKSEVEWEILGWGGPLSHEIRSKASFRLNVPYDNEPSSELQLRFHLKPYKCHEEPSLKFCTKRNKYMLCSPDCSCSTCVAAPLKTDTQIPLEFLPTTGIQSAGYSLLVDVLSPQENLLINVSVVKLNGKTLPVSNKTVSVETDSARENLSLWPNFWRMLYWTREENGKVVNCRNTVTDNVDDARFRFTVTAYELISTVTYDSNVDTSMLKDHHNDPSPAYKEEKDSVASKSGTENQFNVPKAMLEQSSYQSKLPEKESVVTLTCLKGTNIRSIRAKRAVLIENSAYFRRELKKASNELFLNVDFDALNIIIDWITIGEIEGLDSQVAKHVCTLVANHLELDNVVKFWEKLEKTLIKLSNLKDVDNLKCIADKYNLPELKGYIETITLHIPKWIEKDYLPANFFNFDPISQIFLVHTALSKLDPREASKFSKGILGSRKNREADMLTESGFEVVEKPHDDKEKSEEIKKLGNYLNNLLR